MNANFLSRVPNWLVLAGGLGFLALAAYYLVGRAPPASAPANFEVLRKRYEPVARLATTCQIVGTALGIVIGLRLNPKSDALHFGVAAGTGAAAALGCLWLSIWARAGRSWTQYREYQDTYRGKYALPARADIWVLVGLMVWGVIDLWATARGT
jgi:hypothetical protein